MNAKLSLDLPSDRELRVTRTFNAPRALVFDAWTKPELIRRWLLGPSGWTMPVCEVDLRVGGAYRYQWRKDTGETMGMGGVFREIIPGERLVVTEKFDDAWYPGDGALVTHIFTEQNRKTLSTMVVLYESKEARDIAMQSGMTDGMEAGYARLDEAFAEIQGAA